jgi:hypothetical protein
VVRKELVELVTLHLNTLEEIGERERFFGEHHITFYQHDTPGSISTQVPVDDGTFVQSYRVPLAA